MGKQRIVIAVLLSVLENRYAGHGRVCRCAEVKAPGGGVDELALEKYKTSLPPNHARLIGKRAEPSQRGVDVRACWFFDGVRGDDVQGDGSVVGAARECGHHFIDSTPIIINMVERQAWIERIRAIGGVVS